MILGIDYGSKLAGTTVVAFEQDGFVRFEASDKKQDADQMILDLAEDLSPKLVAIDAPLSLPGVYQGLPGAKDYFYRKADSELKAMSPMFLGGLTARAIKLKDHLEKKGVTVIEAYPVKTGSDLGLKDHGYRSKDVDFPVIIRKLTQATSWQIREEGLTGHHIDAVLALYTAQRFREGLAKQAGIENEGLIYY